MERLLAIAAFWAFIGAVILTTQIGAREILALVGVH